MSNYICTNAITYVLACPSISPFSAKCTPPTGVGDRMGAWSHVHATWLFTTTADWTQPGIIHRVSFSNRIGAQFELLFVAQTAKTDIWEYGMPYPGMNTWEKTTGWERKKKEKKTNMKKQPEAQEERENYYQLPLLLKIFLVPGSTINSEILTINSPLFV